MVRWESIVIAVVGTILGLAVGIACGRTVVRAMTDDGIGTLAVPIGSIVSITVIAAVAGSLAAVLPARRAAKLDVLRALVTQ